ncbi:interferon-induced protein 44-like [Periophthalmus magnuspinnatus]|uniref:interferon-induced protein 44-like n=1 Tax=Periophthalmus magnuspinnatus TaxID=409849 RepID=UPI00243673BE|nr:interferon-induced protein 44-like [Periophthalmus magnuspinnatus]
MGHTHTKEVVHVRSPAPPPAPPTPMFDEPWRKIDWGNKEELLKMINRYTPRHGEKHLRVLVYGPVGAGKSTFINSVTSALYERMSNEAAANTSDSATRSFTLEYETHYIFKEDSLDETYPFVFNDIMGLEGGEKQGIHPEDIKLAMKGHVRDGYKFNPMSPLSEDSKHYNPNPTIDDQVHVLVLMLSANCPEIDHSVIQKMKEVRETARDLGIPQIAMGTHVDKACPEIMKDIKNIYRSKSMKTNMEEFSKAVGVPLNCIMGVKNYSEETDNDADVDTLLLIALKHIVTNGKDFVRKQAHKKAHSLEGDMSKLNVN